MIVMGVILEEVTTRYGNGNGGRRIVDRVKPAARVGGYEGLGALLMKPLEVIGAG